MRANSLLIGTLASLASEFVVGCWGQTSEEPPIHPIINMHDVLRTICSFYFCHDVSFVERTVEQTGTMFYVMSIHLDDHDNCLFSSELLKQTFLACSLCSNV